MGSQEGAAQSTNDAFTKVSRRAVVLAVLLSVEYLALALRFDGLLFRYAGWWQELAHLVTLIAVCATGILVLSGAEVLRALREESQRTTLPSLWPGLSVHALAVLGTLVAAWVLEQREWTPRNFGWMALTLGACGFTSALAAMLATLRVSAWRALAHRLRGTLVFGAIAGVLAFGAGTAAELLWEPLASSTLTITHAMLSQLFSHVVMLREERILGVGGFLVEVAKECSGLEGMGLMFTFCSLYLWQNRAHLRFPLALALLPLSVLAIYIANLLRIVGLMWIGARVSPAIALGGFHSKAGWVFFCAVTLGVVALATRWKLVQLDVSHGPAPTQPDEISHAATPASPYLMPFIAVMATTLVTGMFSAGAVDLLYPLRVGAALVALFVYRDALVKLPWRISFAAPVIGAAVFVLWLWLAPSPSAEDHAEMKLAMAGLGPWWLAARVLGTAVTVPIVEELAFRGFLLRRMASVDFERVAFTHRGWLAIVVSSLLFGALHQGQVVAGCVAGLAYGLAMVHRGSLGDAVVAHGITNAMLVAYAIGWDRYAYL